ncbi:MAG TPA: NUDIX hydrolase [Thermoanaerobaculia bacterium]|nr:NUDIX hydrolase [Thermoanaerobaculia bacterium]
MTFSEQQLPIGAGSAGTVEPRPAASAIVLRNDPFEVLFLRRSASSSFVPDAWIFPGGAVDPVDRRLAPRFGASEDAVMRLCAARELFEESGIWIGPALDAPQRRRERLLDDPGSFEDLVRTFPPRLDALMPTSRWITPAGVPKRYDTWFFLLAVEDGTEATIENREGVDMAWLRPSAALELHRGKSFPMVFPTIRNLMAIDGFSTRRELLASREGIEIRPTCPRLVVEQGRTRIVLPDEP